MRAPLEFRLKKFFISLWKKNMKNELKFFFIKLVSIVFAIILIINTTYNLIFASKVEEIFKVLNKTNLENKIREEINSALEKDRIFYEEDKKLIRKLYLKIKNELESD